MNSVTSLEAAIDPNNRLTFLLDWEITLKCNLDCSYCDVGLYGGHDNSTRHPDLDQCLKTIDFMFQYIDYAMQQRIPGLRFVMLNVYGGESLNHPDIVSILQAVRERHQPYQGRWHLTITTTTNAIVSKKKIEDIIPLIDEFTVSYHTENSVKQKSLFRSNCLKIKSAGKKIKCIVLMHGEPELFEDAQQHIAWCNQHDIKHLPRQLDRAPQKTQFDYDKKQVIWFENLYNNHSSKSRVNLTTDGDYTNLSAQGRACCGGRQLCADSNYRQRHFFVNNQFKGWTCSVDKFFLYIKQVTGEVFVNKDCKMNFDGTVGPIGHLDQPDKILQQQPNTVPIVCDKKRCYCGLCAPKAQDPETYKKIIRKYFE